MSAAGQWHLAYHRRVMGLLEDLATTQEPAIQEAARLLATSWTNGGRLLMSQTHHALHLEATGRAGGPVAAEILQDVSDFDDASELLNIESGDVVVIHSNSGSHGKAVGIALLAQEAGAPVIALTMLPFELSDRVRPGHPTGRSLHEVADVVVDLGGDVGDAALPVPGSDLGLAPTSGVTGFTAFWMIVARATELMAANGDLLILRESHHFDGGEQRNARRIALWQDTGLPFTRLGDEAP